MATNGVETVAPAAGLKAKVLDPGRVTPVAKPYCQSRYPAEVHPARGWAVTLLSPCHAETTII